MYELILVIALKKRIRIINENFKFVKIRRKLEKRFNKLITLI